ncbi:MAG: hypothetical protein CM1200mP11_4100 [Nitrosopumilaceae archaeon]|nr:MAG: hypothetical protein CM1200mP11_4100 [Nitrosopumilaceae archaeon]
MNSKILLAASLIAVFTIGLSAQSSLAFAHTWAMLVVKDKPDHIL